MGNVDSCIFILPQDTPLEFSHQFLQIVLTRSLGAFEKIPLSISDFGRIPFMSLKILSKFRSHREYLVHTQAHAEKCFLSAAHMP